MVAGRKVDRLQLPACLCHLGNSNPRFANPELYDHTGSQGFWSPRWSPDGKYLAALGGLFHNLALFSFATQKWEVLAKGEFDWPDWSHNSRFVYLAKDEASLVRFNIKDHRTEEVTSLKGFHTTAYFYWGKPWHGLTPDDRPIATRDTGIEEDLCVRSGIQVVSCHHE